MISNDASHRMPVLSCIHDVICIQEDESMYTAKAYSAASATSSLVSTTIPRREPTDRDVQIETLFCGICHSDLHYSRNEWRDTLPAVYPCVPGHEIVGRVTNADPPCRSTSQATWLPSDASWTQIAPARAAARDWRTFVLTKC